MEDLLNKSPIFFAVGTGRCGTKFLSKVCTLEKSVSSVHERNPLNETFHRYCKWYGIDVDNAGFLETKKREIEKDLREKSFSFESSAYLSLSIQELYECFNAKFILLVRSPEKVINSYLKKGWYDKPFMREDNKLPPSFQDTAHFHHFLGRIIPSGDKYIQWNKMSRVGKLAWYWNALNASVVEQFEKIPENNWKIERLEDFSYKKYLELAEFIGFQSSITEAEYRKLSKSRPNSLNNLRSIETWNRSEIEEFEQEVTPMAKYFNYEYLVDELVLRDQQKSIISQKSNKWFAGVEAIRLFRK